MIRFCSFLLFAFLFFQSAHALPVLASKDYADKIADALTSKEDISNKVVNFEGADDTKYPSALAVKTALDTKVDTGAEATQTLNGNYTVAGSLIVPTQPLPE